MNAKADITPVRIAVLCSSDGGVLQGLCRVRESGQWPYKIAGVVTDRPCGAEQIAKSNGVNCKRIIPSRSGNWSVHVAHALQTWSPDAVLLLIMRKVGPEIWRDLDCTAWNLHPSLLPAYPGLDALERNFADAKSAALQGQELRMGATIHVVNDLMDGGPIISQRFFTIQDAPTLQHAHHLCYLYKIALVLECVCKLIDGTLPTWRDANDSRTWSDRYSTWNPYEPITDVHMRLAEPWAAEWARNRVHQGAARLAGKFLNA